MKSFAYTQIRHFCFRGYGIRSIIKELGYLGPFPYCSYKVYPCSNFFEELSYAVSRVTEEIGICRLELSSREFIQLVKAAKKVKYLGFGNCKISFDSEFDFGPMEGCLIEKIEISNFGQHYYERSEYEECLNNIFCGILKCTNLIRSLEVLHFAHIQDLKEIMIEKAKVILGEEYLEIMPSLKNL